MVKNLPQKNIAYTAITTLAFVMACMFNATAQSLHAAIWYFDGLLYDFSSTPMSLSKIGNDNWNEVIWYIDADGHHALTVADKVLYDSNMEPIPTDYGWHRGFFVPVPNNENLVYYIEIGRCHLIDINKRSVTDMEYVIDVDAITHISVHNSQCNKVWIIDNTADTVWHEYLLSADRIEKIRDIHLDQENFKYPLDKSGWKLGLSVDCKHYTLTNFKLNNNTEVYYGDFDRQNGNFNRKASYDFGNGYIGILWSAIAYDNSRIYYTLLTTDRQYQILEVPIVGGLPMYDQGVVVLSKTFTYPITNTMYHAIDGKIYCNEIGNCCISSISIDDDGKTIYNVLVSSSESMISNSTINQFVSTWFMDDPCNPCADMKPPKIISE
ncbi:MAG: hypothetical protein J6T70_07445 [Bacteroidales bacterium]|nr:hypothetical protein [Bacteroidales bacterium]